MEVHLDDCSCVEVEKMKKEKANLEQKIAMLQLEATDIQIILSTLLRPFSSMGTLLCRADEIKSQQAKLRNEVKEINQTIRDIEKDMKRDEEAEGAQETVPHTIETESDKCFLY